MSYQLLVDLIEKHKIELATKIAKQAVVLKVTESGQLQSDIEGFANSLSMMASYIRDNNIKEWQSFVEQVTKAQVARGVPDAGALAIADFMTDCLIKLVGRELTGLQNKTLHDRFQQRIQNMHSLGRVMILVTQMKEHGNNPPRQTT